MPGSFREIGRNTRQFQENREKYQVVSGKKGEIPGSFREIGRNTRQFKDDREKYQVVLGQFKMNMNSLTWFSDFSIKGTVDVISSDPQFKQGKPNSQCS